MAFTYCMIVCNIKAAVGWQQCHCSSIMHGITPPAPWYWLHPVLDSGGSKCESIVQEFHRVVRGLGQVENFGWWFFLSDYTYLRPFRLFDIFVNYRSHSASQMTWCRLLGIYNNIYNLNIINSQYKWYWTVFNICRSRWWKIFQIGSGLGGGYQAKR